MQTDHKLFDDLAKMASGTVGGLMEMKREIESMVSTQIEKILQRMHFVTKEEFDTVMGMLSKSREEQEYLKARLEALEKKLGG